MELKEVIYHRRSIRAYDEKPVEKNKLEELIAAATQAPSAMNSQPWAFGIIQDKARLADISAKSKNYLLQMIEHKPILANYKNLFTNDQFNIFYNADSLVVIYAKPAGPYPTGDCFIAAQNLMLMAKDMGLGTCWIGFAAAYLNTAEAKQAFGVPIEYEAVAPIIVGYPSREPAYLEKAEPEILYWR